MFLKYDDCGSNIIINLPEAACWKLHYELWGEYSDFAPNSLYLIINDEKILIRDPDCACYGRGDLQHEHVGAMYEEIVNVIASKIASNPALKIIDITAIENELLEGKYIQKWTDEGLIDEW